MIDHSMEPEVSWKGTENQPCCGEPLRRQTRNQRYYGSRATGRIARESPLLGLTDPLTGSERIRVKSEARGKPIIHSQEVGDAPSA